MICEWVSGMQINLGTESKPMTWEIIYTKTEQNRWQLTMDFTNQGSLKLECSSLHLKTLDENRT